MIKKKSVLTLAISLFVFMVVAMTSTAHAATMITGKRFAGQDRYQTAVSISKNGWPGGAQAAVLTVGEDFPDALCSAPLAKKLNAPILLTQTDKLNKDTASELSRLKPDIVYIIGGTGAVSKGVESQISSMGFNYKRVYGADRYGTSSAIAGEMGNVSNAVIATGEDFPDALSIASWAAAKGAPILLVEKNNVPAEIERYIDKNKVNISYVIGGSGVVSDTILKKFPGSRRLWGIDRYSTNIAVMKYLDNDFNYSNVFMSTGENFPDALAGSAMAAASKSPLLLVSIRSSGNTKKVVDSKSGMIKNVYLLGDNGALDNYTISKIMPSLIVGIDIGLPAASVGPGKSMKASINAVTVTGDRVQQGITCRTADTKIASIDSNGNIYGIKEGDTNIIATLGNLEYSQRVSVRNKRLIVVDPGHGGFDGGASAKDFNGKSIPGSSEAALNFQIAQKLKYKLESEGYAVLLTRNGDTFVSLQGRAQFANDQNPDLFISIHHDAATSSSTGTSAFYSGYRPGIDKAGLYAVASANAPVYDMDGRKIGYLSKGSTYPYCTEANGDIYIIYNNAQARVSINDVMVYDRNPENVAVQSKKLAESVNKNISALGLLARGAQDQNFAVIRLTNGVSLLTEVGFISNPSEFLRVSQSSFQDKVAGAIANAINDYFIGIAQ